MVNKNKLRVFYGWTRINKVRKTEAISIIYENRKQSEDKVEKLVLRQFRGRKKPKTSVIQSVSEESR